MDKSHIAVDEFHIGFTGTRHGMTGVQRLNVRDALARKVAQNPNVLKFFHHGDCVGADAEAHDYARELGFAIIIHPPTDPKYRAFKEGDIILPERYYISRNRDIVDASHIVIAAPNTMAYQVRSGTWSTINYARDHEKLWKIVKPFYFRPIVKK